MTAATFQSTDNPPESNHKRFEIAGTGSCGFLWIPGLTVNGETCMSTSLIEFNGGDMHETNNKNAVVEGIRLAWAWYTY